MIALTYGERQQFRSRYRDLNLLGRVEGAMPLRHAVYRLNGGPATAFYVEQIPGPPDLDWRFQYKSSPARLRLPHRGDFNVEIPVGSPRLEAGTNEVLIDIEDGDGRHHAARMVLTWDPRPVSLPLDLRDLSGFGHAQEVGQIVNGAFDLDPHRNVLTARAPVAPDALLVLGGPAGSQEATYDVVFADPHRAKYLGLSDFFVGHEEEDPPLGIKPGWSTAGLATLTYGWRPGSPPEVRPLGPDDLAPLARVGEARAWIACADNSRRRERWLVRTDPPATVPIEAGVTFRVRHQVRFENGVNHTRFRLWPADQPEPGDWLCAADDRRLAADAPRFSRASFGLFQHTGMSTEWSNILVVPLPAPR